MPALLALLAATIATPPAAWRVSIGLRPVPENYERGDERRAKGSIRMLIRRADPKAQGLRGSVISAARPRRQHECLWQADPVGTGAPSGTVTFLFTDIEGSTKLWESAPEAMRAALERHDSILRSAIDGHDGYVFSTGGDGLAAAFARAGDALQAAVDAQVALADEAWPDSAPLRVRMGLHTGEVEEREGDYFGTAVNRAARLMAAAHGRQVVCSGVTASLAGGASVLMDLGEHRLRDLSAPQRVFQVGTDPFPALRSLEAFPTNLPAQSNAFVGREVQLAELTTSLKASRVVTLTGVGGVGKTRLALQVAADVLPSYPDGAWLVDLAGAVNPSWVLFGITTPLTVLQERQTEVALRGIQQQADSPDETHIIAYVADHLVRLVRLGAASATTL